MNIKEIIEAWVIAHNPTETQQELAEKRLSICENCPSKITLVRINMCSECGCPVTKKVFTKSFNPCPLKKWGEADQPYYSIKNLKTLI